MAETSSNGLGATKGFNNKSKDVRVAKNIGSQIGAAEVQHIGKTPALPQFDNKATGVYHAPVVPHPKSGKPVAPRTPLNSGVSQITSAATISNSDVTRTPAPKKELKRAARPLPSAGVAHFTSPATAKNDETPMTKNGVMENPAGAEFKAGGAMNVDGGGVVAANGGARNNDVTFSGPTINVVDGRVV